MNTRHIYEVCRPLRIFGGVYAKDTYIQTVKQEDFWFGQKKWF